MSESPAELDDFDRNLLRAARTDAPGAGAIVRAAAALGLGIGAAAPTVAAAATAVRAVSLASMKWTLIGALGVVSVGSGTVAYLRSSRPAVPAVSAPAAVPERAEVRTVTPSVPATVPTPAAEPLAPKAGAAPAPASLAVSRPAAPALHASASKDDVAAPSPAAPASTAAAASGVSIAEEVAAVDRARHALRQGHAGEALDELNRYQARWPKGVLATEVVVLRVEARLRLGDRAAAKNEARAFIAAHPGTRYAARLKELFEPGELD